MQFRLSRIVVCCSLIAVCLMLALESRAQRQPEHRQPAAQVNSPVAPQSNLAPARKPRNSPSNATG